MIQDMFNYYGGHGGVDLKKGICRNAEWTSQHLDDHIKITSQYLNSIRALVYGG